MTIYGNNKKKVKDIFYNNKTVRSVYYDGKLAYQKAYAWKYTATATKTTSRILLSNYNISNEINCTSTNGAGRYVVVIDKKLYRYNESTGVLTQQGTDTDYSKPGYGVVIKGGKLYTYFDNFYVDNGTTWTHIGMGLMGIKNNKVYRFYNQGSSASATLQDSSLNAKAMVTPDQDYTRCLVIDINGYPYFLKHYYNSSTNQYVDIKLKLSGIINNLKYLSSSANFNYGYFASDNIFYVFKINHNENTGNLLSSISCNETIKKICREYYLTTNNNLYKINGGTSGFVGEYVTSDVYDICQTGYISFDGFYNYNHEKKISGLFGQIYNQDNTYGAPNAVIFTPTGTTRTKIIYTTSKNPAVNNNSYFDLKSNINKSISSANTSRIIVNGTTFTRDTSSDSYFDLTTNITE